MKTVKRKACEGEVILIIKNNASPDSSNYYQYEKMIGKVLKVDYEEDRGRVFCCYEYDSYRFFLDEYEVVIEGVEDNKKSLAIEELKSCLQLSSCDPAKDLHIKQAIYYLTKGE